MLLPFLGLTKKNKNKKQKQKEKEKEDRLKNPKRAIYAKGE